jgi:anti-anti-sigma regulatory factor
MERLPSGGRQEPPGMTEAAVVYAGNYLNRLSGERIERECRLRLEAGCRTLIVNFRDTELVNSIGISILLGIIDIAQQYNASVTFAEVNAQTAALFEMLGLTRYVSLVQGEGATNGPRPIWPMDC